MTTRRAPLVYFDANPLIYAFEAAPEIADPVQSLLKRLRSVPGAAVTSELVLAELLAPVNRPDVKPLSLRRRFYFELLIYSRLFDLRPVTRDVLLETADLRQVLNLKLPDAIHMVTALQAGCSFFLSNDSHARRAPEGLTRIAPDAHGIDTIMQAIGDA